MMMKAAFSSVATAVAALLLHGAAAAQQGPITPAPQQAPQVLAPASSAAESAPAAAASAAVPVAPAPAASPREAAPPNRLGQQVNAPVPIVMPAGTVNSTADGPSVVYPPAEAIVERAVRQIENMQLTPEQVERLKSIYIERQQQRSMPYLNPAKPVTRTLLVNLDPGVAPPTLRLSRGQQTSLVFSDVSGQPWMIEKVSMNRQLFSDGRVIGAGQGGQGGQAETPTNVLSIEALTPAAYGNVTVTLRGQSTPVIFVLTTGQAEVDMRVDAKVPGRNPDAEAEVSMQAAPGLDNAMPYFLDGVPPASAKRLRVTGLDGAEAWVYDRNLYVKARANAQYPAYFAAARSTSGVSVYRYVGVPKAATFTIGGRAQTAFFE
ncbi:DotH/IcmK family type IV secretion protein [Comamonas thiooxydans]|uniref:DotH/IcmK family type IV secretion protein n=2 Tax=Pseudomonadota TaxID=1224 RepID=UPI001C0F2171|nr:DotH/IcmK family type IV secretion protein [Comamonas thiooxydans]